MIIRRYRKPKPAHRWWFAWYPVRCRDTGDLVWWEKVWRVMGQDYSGSRYDYYYYHPSTLLSSSERMSNHIPR